MGSQQDQETEATRSGKENATKWRLSGFPRDVAAWAAGVNKQHISKVWLIMRTELIPSAIGRPALLAQEIALHVETSRLVAVL